MSDPQKRSNLLTELSRRQVFRSAAAYVVVAWVMVQVGSIIFPEFGAPDWAMRALIILFIAGFPPAMLLAWTIDLSSKGIVRTPESGFSKSAGHWPRLLVTVIATAMSGAALWWAWDDYIVRPDGAGTRVAIKTQPAIAVHAPGMITGDSDDDWLGEGIANLVRSELAESQHVRLISHAQWNRLSAGASSTEQVAAIAGQAGIDYLVTGDLYEMPDGITLTVHVDDIEAGVTINSPRISAADGAGIIARVPQITTSIKSSLNIPYTENVGVFEADFASRHIGAYEAYIAGLAYLIDFEYGAAEKAFKQALDVAPDYHIARFRLAQVYEYSGRSKLAQQALDRIPADAPFSDRLRLYVEGAKAYFVESRDMDKAIEVYRRLVELYPYESEAGHYLAEAYWLDFQDDASIAEFRRISDLHPFDPVSWMSLGERLLDVGELDEAKIALERYASMQPDDDFAHALLGNLAMLQGDYNGAIARHGRALELNPGFVVAVIGLARTHYLDGSVDAAIDGWRSLIGDSAAAPSFRIDAAFDLAGVYRGLGRFSDSIQLLEDMEPLLQEEGLRLAMSYSERGTAELALGRTERADAAMANALANAPDNRTRYLFARGLLELELDRNDALLATIEAIRAGTSGGEGADWTEENAADYLEAMLRVAEEDIEQAITVLTNVVERPGYQYAIYRAGLATALRAAGQLERAAELAIQAATARDAGDLRLDLEFDRTRARLLHAEILAEQGLPAATRKQVAWLLDRLRDADPEMPELDRLGALSGASAGNASGT